MPYHLNSREADFERGFRRILASRADDEAGVAETTADIIAQIRAGGDEAVLKLTQKFDGVGAETVADLALGRAAMAAAWHRLDTATQNALTLAAGRIRAFHAKQIPQDIDYTDSEGVRLGLRHTPLDSVGIYVPGGKAAYPSSVLMGAIPATVAGVKRIIMATPTPDGKIADSVLAAAHIAQIDTIWRIGGVQAIAAMAYGTKTIAPVDKIIGPGNAYVAQAKRLVFGQVGIDSLAGPSEILILADAENNPDWPDWIAMDLLSQAEHDEMAQALLITTDADFAAAVAASVKRILPRLQRSNIATASWSNHGGIITVRDWQEGAALTNRLAPEHLMIATQNPEELASTIRHAGAIFLGAMTPEAVGDYIGGTNHILPTGRCARFQSGLGVADFIKRTSLLGCDAASLTAIGKDAITLAQAEGLEAHALSIGQRLGQR